MLVLVNEMFDSPPVFAWVLPVFVRLKPGMEETFSPRHGQLAANLQQWKHEQQRIVGEALLNKRPHPELTPWVPPKPTLLQGIFFYQKTHMEELQLEKTKNAIRQVFIDTGITPFEDGRWNQYRR